MDPIDVIMLSHNRLEHLVRTVDALIERTPEPPIRLTVVDNASEPDVRNWLADNGHRFERLILRPTNEHMPAIQHGIEASSSDPFVVTDPDIEVPEMTPSWLARQLDVLDRHPDFGMVAVDLAAQDGVLSLLPPDEAERIRSLRGDTREVDRDLTEGYAGAAFQLIRRDALREPYVRGFKTCDSVRRAGYRFGWNPTIKARHLGSFDLRRYPEYLARKEASAKYVRYGALLDQIQRPPTLGEIARAAPIIARTRAAGVPDSSVLEVAWGTPALSAAVDGPLTLHEPAGDGIPLDAGAAGAVILLDPPPERVPVLIGEAFRIAARLVITAAPLEALGGRLAADLAPAGWHGAELPWIGELPLALARAGDASHLVSERLGFSTLEHRENWLELFAAGAFGAATHRLYVFEADGVPEVPPAVRHAPGDVTPWRAEERTTARPSGPRTVGGHRLSARLRRIRRGARRLRGALRRRARGVVARLNPPRA